MLKVKNIGGWTLKQCRKHLGIKQKELGNMLGYSMSTAETRIGQYECGARNPKKNYLKDV